jgi:hypothetical protein
MRLRVMLLGLGMAEKDPTSRRVGPGVSCYGTGP